MAESTEIKVAVLQTEVAHLAAASVDIQQGMKAMLDELKGIRLTLAETRGGWKTLIKMGSAGFTLSCTIGALAAWAINFLYGHPPSFGVKNTAESKHVEKSI